jgi:GntR family transcriptional regulator/MocR family aminotransferase
VVPRRGAGVFVADVVTVPTPRREPALPGSVSRLNPVWLQPDLLSAIGFWRERPQGESAPRSAHVDFRPALVDSRLFPLEVFRRVSAKQLRALERRPARFRSPQGNQGNHRLREAVTRHIGITRAVACAPEDVLVTSGAQQAFDLLARVLVIPGQTVVAVEDPGYPPLRAVFIAAGARVVPVPVDAEGIVIEAIPAEATLICVCPSHQFPLGVTLSAARRRQLIALARRRGAAVMEDDYDGEFRFEGGALEALRTLEAADTVFYVGTFSKCMLPALRLGFIVMPTWARRALTAAKNCLDWHSSVPLQTTVAAFIAEGHLTRHVRRMREVYRRRREVLAGALSEELGEWLEPLPSYYGMHIAATARRGVDLEAVAAAAQAKGVSVHSLSRYFLGAPDRTGLILGYGAADLRQIELGVRRLQEIFRG